MSDRAMLYDFSTPASLALRFEAYWRRQERCDACRDAVMPHKAFCPEHWSEARGLLLELARADIWRARSVPVPLELKLECSLLLANQSQPYEKDNMPIIAKDSSESYELHPATLTHAVCVDVVDLGMVETIGFKGDKKMTHKVKVVWQSEEQGTNGKPLLLYRRYTLSLNDKASLTRDLQSWRGRPFTEEERRGFDLERLIGVNCFINVIHEEHDGKTFANVASISPVRRDTPRLFPAKDYIREKDRQKTDELVSHPRGPQISGMREVAPIMEEETVPF